MPQYEQSIGIRVPQTSFTHGEGQGTTSTTTGEGIVPARTPRRRRRHRRDKIAHAHDGLRVRLDPIPGLTKKGLLDKHGFTLQCPPLDEFAVEYAYTYQDYDTIQAGQFGRPNSRQLRSITFDSLAVDMGRDHKGNFEPRWVVNRSQFRYVEDYVDRLVAICESGQPFLLTCYHRVLPPTHRDPHPPPAVEVEEEAGSHIRGAEVMMPANIRTLRVSEKAGEGDARYFNVNFVEFRDPFININARRRGDAHELPLTLIFGRSGLLQSPRDIAAKFGSALPHTPTPADMQGQGGGTTGQGQAPPPARSGKSPTLAQLSKLFYGDPFFALEIARANSMEWGANDPISESPRFKRLIRHHKHFKLTIPKAPKNTPSREDFGFLVFGDWAQSELG